MAKSFFLPVDYKSLQEELNTLNGGYDRITAKQAKDMKLELEEVKMGGTRRVLKWDLTREYKSMNAYHHFRHSKLFDSIFRKFS